MNLNPLAYPDQQRTPAGWQWPTGTKRLERPCWPQSERLYQLAQTMPTLDLQFAANRTLVDNIRGRNLVTFTRASSATYVDRDGWLKIAGTNQPRFDHNPVTGESLGLLVEEARTNIGTYSEQLDNAAWVWQSGTKTVTANAITAPDGTLTADMVTASTFTEIVQPNSGLVGPKAFSIFLKAGTLSVVQLRLFSSTSPSERQVDFNLLTGTATVANGASVTSGSIQAFPDGWYRCTIVVSDVSVANSSFIRANGETFYAWGAQTEAGAFPTSYIPTTTSTVTRAADVASITGANFSSWYNRAQGSFYAQFKFSSAIARNPEAEVLGTSGYSGNGFMGWVAGTASQLLTIRAATGFTDLKTLVPSYSIHSNPFASGLVNNGKFEGYPLNLEIGAKIPEGYLNGTIARIIYFPARLHSSILQRIIQ